MIGTQSSYHKSPSTLPAFNYDSHVKELNDRFGRLVKQLGPNNKAGSTRHEFETEFSYALNELKNCPLYLQGKRFDQATAIVASLLTAVKKVQDDKSNA